MNSRLVLLGLCLVFVADFASALRHSQWAAYKRLFGKSYFGDEDAVRKSILTETQRKVQEHNAKERTFTMGLNHLSDWTSEELNKLNGLKVPTQMLMNSPQAQKFVDEILKSDAPIPDSVDWRKVPGRVSPVKDQGQCGSCWAFATTGVLEGQEAVQTNYSRTHKMTALSEQDLVDCSTNNLGCDGGFMLYGLEDIQRLGGIESEQAYPYKATADKKCQFVESKSVMSDKGGALLPQDDKEALKKVVATYGPVAVAMDVEEDFFAYKSGIYTNNRCSAANLNHGVLVVGYGTDANNGDYWIVKNSWSDTWGDNGYFMISQESDCGISHFATVPTF